MAKDPENLVLVMLREIRAKQDEHSERFAGIETELADVKKQLSSMSKVVTYSLGQTSETQLRQTEQELRIDELFDKIEKLLTEDSTS